MAGRSDPRNYDCGKCRDLTTRRTAAPAAYARHMSRRRSPKRGRHESAAPPGRQESRAADRRGDLRALVITLTGEAQALGRADDLLGAARIGRNYRRRSMRYSGVSGCCWRSRIGRRGRRGSLPSTGRRHWTARTCGRLPAGGVTAMGHSRRQSCGRSLQRSQRCSKDSAAGRGRSKSGSGGARRDARRGRLPGGSLPLGWAARGLLRSYLDTIWSAICKRSLSPRSRQPPPPARRARGDDRLAVEPDGSLWRSGYRGEHRATLPAGDVFLAHVSERGIRTCSVGLIEVLQFHVIEADCWTTCGVQTPSGCGQTVGSPVR